MPPGDSHIDASSAAIFELVDEHAPVEQVASGFGFTEGPVWHPTGRYLLFSDIPASTRYRYSRSDGVDVVATATNRANGLTLDANLELIVCEHSTSVVARIGADGRREVLASHYQGSALNSPNDLCVRSDGSIYFTDPRYGRSARHGLERPPELDFKGVFRIAPDGELRLLVDRATYYQPNGLCFSPVESLLYVDDTPRALIDVYDVARDGSLGSRRAFFAGIGSGRDDDGVVDGIKCDERGNVWVTGPGGIWVISPAGEQLGVIRVPEQTTNLAWGGDDWRTLFVTASTGLYAIGTLVGPRREPFMAA
jgi:gluconolactonase